MYSPRLPIETVRVVSLEKMWSSWAAFDSDGHWVWGKEGTLRLQYGKTCRGRVTDGSTVGGRRLLRNSAARSLERAMYLSDMRMERVARIRAAIASGCYHVSSEDLAQKLIGGMLGGLQ
jgi:anti-sigma28 factor (negative regulator of flagellin synthesis)